MNRNVKSVAIGGATGFATYFGEIVPWLIETISTMDLPDNIESAIAGITVAVVGYLVYRFLPASTEA